MPDLDQIKQGEQGGGTGMGGSPSASPAILAAGLAARPTGPLGRPSCCSTAKPLH